MAKDFINKIRNILVSPTEFWRSVKEENISQVKLLTSYYLPLVLIASFAVFIGAWFSSSHFYIGFALLKSLREFVLFTLFYLVCVFIINSLAPVFKAEKNLHLAQLLIIYSLTPFLVVSILTGIFPGLYILGVLGLYSAWLFRLGVKELNFIAESKLNEFILISIILCLFVFGIMSIILWKIFTFFY